MRRILRTLVTLVFCAACNSPQPPAESKNASDAAAHTAHEAYVTAINSNNLDALLAVLTDDVVFLSAHEAPMVGKAAVRPWLDAYLKAYKTHWDKPVQEFTVSGDWAFAVVGHYADKRPQQRLGGVENRRLTRPRRQTCARALCACA